MALLREAPWPPIHPLSLPWAAATALGWTRPRSAPDVAHAYRAVIVSHGDGAPIGECAASPPSPP